MNGKLKVTIGICAYNVEKYIMQSLKSALDQTYENIDVIVIDDGSTDGTGALLDFVSDDRLTVVHKQNEGLAAGREQLIQMLGGDAVYWLDADDYLLPNAVANNVFLMEKHSADIVKTALFKKDEALCGIYTREAYMHILLPDTIKSNVIGCLIKKEAYDGVHHKIGLINDDYYAFPRVADNTRKIVLENSGTYHYREVRPGSITHSGRSSFSGFYPRAIHRNDRYERYRQEFPDECRIVLKQFTDYACMSCLYGGNDPRVDEIKALLVSREDDIARCGTVSAYKKWLVREILSNEKALGAARVLHKIKGRARTILERLGRQ